jgi:branched-subunit amino acid permease
MAWWNNFVSWLQINPARESQNMQAAVNGAGGAGKSPGTDTTSPSYLQQAGDMLPTIATDLEWLIVALVGLLAYVFIFKR